MENANAIHQRKSIADKQSNYLESGSQIAWGAILIGTIVSLGYEVLLNFLGIGLGLSAFDLTGDKMLKVGAGAIIWLAISGIISMGIGGYFVGLFSNITCSFKRGCHAVAAWSLATLLTVLITTTASGVFLGGAVNIAKNSTAAISQANSSNNSEQNKNTAATQTMDSSTNAQQTDASEKADKATDQMAKASIILFFAFLLSGAASVASAVFVMRNSVNPTIKTN